MPELILSNGLVALVDADDFLDASDYTWTHKKPHTPGDRGYAVRGVRIDGKVKIRSLQRDVMRPPPDMKVIFLNHDSLDGRRANLPVVDPSTANRHNRVRTDSGTGVKGVKYHAASGTWQAVITVDGKPLHLGTFWTEDTALAEYEAARRRYFPDQPEATGDATKVSPAPSKLPESVQRHVNAAIRARG